jgi:hypothetical protein
MHTTLAYVDVAGFTILIGAAWWVYGRIHLPEEE